MKTSTPQSPNREQKFMDYQKQSINALKQLNKKCIQENIFDPLVYKQRTLIDQLHSISESLQLAWKETDTNDDTNKATLSKAMRLLHELALSLDDLNKDNEKKFIETLDEFNNTTTHYNDEIIKIRAAYASLKKHRTLIERLIYGETLSFSASYLGSTASVFSIIGFACEATLKEAIRHTGSIFNPIVSVFTTIGKLFNFISNFDQIKTEKQIALDEKYHRLHLKEAKKLLRGSNALKFASFALNALTVFIFAGLLLTNPIGWGLVALSCVIDWIDTGLVGVKKAKFEYNIATQALNNAKDGQGYVEDQEVLKNFANKSMALEKAKSIERWGRVNVLAMILFACAPIPIVGQVLMTAGLITFAIVVAKNVYVAVKPRIEEYRKLKKEKAKGEVEMTEIDQNSSEKDLSKKHENKAVPMQEKKRDLTNSTHKSPPWFLQPQPHKSDHFPSRNISTQNDSSTTRKKIR